MSWSIEYLNYIYGRGRGRRFEWKKKTVTQENVIEKWTFLVGDLPSASEDEDETESY